MVQRVVEGRAVSIRVLREGPLQGMSIILDGCLQCSPIRLGKKTIWGKRKSKCQDLKWEQTWNREKVLVTRKRRARQKLPEMGSEK